MNEFKGSIAQRTIKTQKKKIEVLLLKFKLLNFNHLHIVDI